MNNEKKELVIVGAGGFARTTAWVIDRINEKNFEWNVLGYVDDDKEKQGTSLNGYKVLGPIELLKQISKPIHVICTIANPSARKRIIEDLSEVYNIAFATIIDPSAIVGPTGQIDEGVIICPKCELSCNYHINKHVIINPACTIAHDVVVREYCTLYTNVNLAGNVHLGSQVQVGAGSQIIQQLNVGEGTIIGAGSAVVRDLPANCTAVGVPAKPIKFHKI